MSSSSYPFATVIMAGGKGTRMLNAEKAKVMFEVGGRPMIDHVVELARSLGSSRIIAVVGYRRETVAAHLKSTGAPVECAIQEPQLGTGHAVMQTEKFLRKFEGDVLVLSGDVPLLRKEAVEKLIAHHRSRGAVATILTADLDDPKGYGRILRGEEGHVLGIVEEKDATDEQRRVREINSGIYIFVSSYLYDGLAHITTDNAQKEYYLTDVFGYFWRNGLTVAAQKARDFNEIRGVNTVAQLEEAERVLQARNAG
ncbi:MAG TPA: sugar phosphate nucleotidyltransferase [Bacteroidota bacterium]|nr:sugar phosphate nucleotidyltransferase [Bacteroidota bacterium]